MGHDYTTQTQVIRFLVDNDRAYKPGEVLVSREWAENAPRMT